MLSSPTRCQSWSDQVWWSCGRAAGPVCGPQPPVWNHSTSPRWLCPVPVSPRWSFATLHCGLKDIILINIRVFFFLNSMDSLKQFTCIRRECKHTTAGSDFTFHLASVSYQDNLHTATLRVWTVKTRRTKYRFVFHLTRPVKRGIHTLVRWGRFHLCRAHRLAQMVDQFEIWLKEWKKIINCQQQLCKNNHSTVAVRGFMTVWVLISFNIPK